MSSKFQVYSAVYLLLFNHQEQVLLSKRLNTGFMDGFYGLPSGHLEEGETISQALIRETKEEIGVNLTDFEFVRVNHRMASTENKRDYIDFYFIASGSEDEVKNLEPEKCSELKWFSLDELPENIIPYVKDVLDPPNGLKFFGEV